MKLLLVFVFASSLGMHAFSQEGQLAKSFEEYTKMYQNTKFKMARNHAEFYAEAKKNQALWKHFKDPKFAASFLNDLKFCADGLITINLGVQDTEFEAAVAKTLGFEQSFWSKWEKGYCCEDYDCSPCSVHSKCHTRNCEKAALKGNLFDPAQVLGS